MIETSYRILLRCGNGCGRKFYSHDPNTVHSCNPAAIGGNSEIVALEDWHMDWERAHPDKILWESFS